MIYNSNIIKFNLIIYNIINEKRYMLVIKKDSIIIFLITIIKINNSLKTILTILISLIAKFMFFARSLIANLNISLLNIKLNSLI